MPVGLLVSVATVHTSFTGIENSSGNRSGSPTPATRTKPRRHAASSKRYGAPVAGSSLGSALLRLARSRHLGHALLLEARRLAGQLSQVVKLRAPHRRALGNLDLVDARRVEGKGPLHAHAVGDAPHRERGPGPAPALADHHALEGLQALFLTLDDLDGDAHGVARGEAAAIFLELSRVHDVNGVHDSSLLTHESPVPGRGSHPASGPVESRPPTSAPRARAPPFPAAPAAAAMSATRP